MTEAAVINALKRLGKGWPSTLWLYSAGGTLHVMGKRDGKRLMDEKGSFDPEAVLATIEGIDNDGGDW